jgi:hypothetical protein
MISITRHELRIITMWAEHWAGRVSAQRAFRTIVERIGIQTDTALTLGQEVADLRAAFPDVEVKVHNSDGQTDL